jgi:hypothetical protein
MFDKKDEEHNFAEQLTKTCILLSKLHEVKEGIVGNTYEQYLNRHLTIVENELRRQLTNLDSPAKLNK